MADYPVDYIDAPTPKRDTRGGDFFHSQVRGLTKREYFAALAMQNLQNVLLRRSNIGLVEVFRGAFGGDTSETTIAHAAVAQADALIQALNDANRS